MRTPCRAGLIAAPGLTARIAVWLLAVVLPAPATPGRASAPLPADQIVAPPEPAVRPSIPDTVGIDADGNRIDDALDARIARY
ncbi:MAG: hypothetical protein ACPMAQ_03840, partial [Phycisphaerae bacterium]